MAAQEVTAHSSEAVPFQSRKRKHSSKDSTSKDSKPKKRRRHAELTALPSVPDDSDNDASAAEDNKEDTKSTAADFIPLDSTSTTADPTTDAAAPKKKTKRRKKKTATATDGITANDSATASDKKNRFIAFIGNLPYDTTTQSLHRHFASITPVSIRHLTEKANWNDPSLPSSKARNSGGEASTAPKSKGYAFLEFENYDRLLTCLKLYHHSMFSAVEGKGSSRRINVELTAGGGGAGEGRKEKLRVKNERLGEERKRNYTKDKEARDLDRKAKKARESKTGATGANAQGVGDANGDGGDKKAEAVGAAVADVHPERMRMLENGGRGGYASRGNAGRGRGGSRGGNDRGRARGRGGRGGRGRY